MAAAFCLPSVFAGQTNPAATSPAPAKSSTRTAHPKPSAHRHGARHTAKKAPTPVAAAKPQMPAQPAWPVNEKPNPARITWNAQGLEIVAENSSLDQILDEVATDIGATVTGLSKDERVFGSYGPGPAHEVLDLLLNGTGYNVMMIGDQGNGAPRKIELSTGAAAGSSAQQATSPTNIPPQEDGSDAYGEQAEPPPPTPPLPNGNPLWKGGPPRSPQQILQEMQQRQTQQMQGTQQQNTRP